MNDSNFITINLSETCKLKDMHTSLDKGAFWFDVKEAAFIRIVDKED